LLDCHRFLIPNSEIKFYNFTQIKCFVLILILTISNYSFSQTTENFDTIFNIEYGDQEETHACASGQWASLACNVNADKFRGDTGKAVRFGYDNTIKPYLEFRVNKSEGITRGIGTVSFWTRHWNDNGGEGVSFQLEYKEKDANGRTPIGAETQVTSASYTKQPFAVNQASESLYLRIRSVQNDALLVIDDFELTSYSLSIETHKQGLSFYPNPEMVYLQGVDSPTKAQIYTVSGQSVYKKRNPTTIQVSDLQRGVYIVQIHTLNNEVLTTKLVVR
jgi:hypothetical protein